MKTKSVWKAGVASLLGAWVAARAYALPAFFLMQPAGNQQDVEWASYNTEHFRLYADKNAPQAAADALGALEEALPPLEKLLGVWIPGSGAVPAPAGYVTSPFDKIPVVMSHRSNAGGFANPFTLNLEVQVQSGAGARFYQHELVHRMMYGRMDPGLGPVGRGWGLAFTPVWWIEGLAEYLTESIGISETNAIERQMALEGSWPTWDRIHSLYGVDGDTFLKGYVTSGRFFGFLAARHPDVPLGELHRRLFWRNLIPPFWKGADRVFRSAGETESLEDLYEEYKKAARERWLSTLAHVPRLTGAPWSKAHLVWDGGRSSWTEIQPSVWVSPAFYEAPYQKAFLERDALGLRRVPIEGGHFAGVFATTLADWSNGGFWSTVSMRGANGAAFNWPVWVQIKRGESGSWQVVSEEGVGLGSEVMPRILGDLTAISQQRAYGLSTLWGKTELLLFQKGDPKARVLARWDGVVAAQWIRRPFDKDTSCAMVLLDLDKGRTRIEQFCDGKTRQVILPEGKLEVLGGVEMGGDEAYLQVAWGTTQGMVRLNTKKGTWDPLGPFQERLMGLWPRWGGSGVAATWENLGRDELRVYEKAPFEKEWEDWRKQESLGSRVAPPPWKQGEARFETLTRTEPVPTPATPAPVSVLASEAESNPRHFFTVPWLTPAELGGPGLGLISIPWMDEMERWKFDVGFQKNLATGGWNGTVGYTNQRVWNGLSLRVFQQDRYNGAYYIIPCGTAADPRRCLRRNVSNESAPGTETYQSWLTERGFTVGAGFLERLSGVSGAVVVGLSQWAPSKTNPLDSSHLGVISRLGPMEGTFGHAGFSLSIPLWDEAWYKGEISGTRMENRWLRWSAALSLNAESWRSLGEAKDGNRSSLGVAHWNRVGGGLRSVWRWRRQEFSLRADVGGTLGENTNTPNLREIFSPWRSSIPGLGGLNHLDIPLVGQGTLFSLRKGHWTWRYSGDWTFPVFPALEKMLGPVFLDEIRGEAVISSGGISRSAAFKDREHWESYGLGLRSFFDIKGVSFFPAMLWGQVIGERRGYLFAQLAFSEYF